MTGSDDAPPAPGAEEGIEPDIRRPRPRSEPRDAAAEKHRVAERLADAGLATDRFIEVTDGEKGTYDHTQQPPDVVTGNYGVYAGRGLVAVDVDTGTAQGASALDLWPETLTVCSPHAEHEREGHRFLRIDGYDDHGDTLGEALDAELGKRNPKPAWGEVRAHNQYVVGPGSQLDGCDKDGCEECADPDGGYYRIADNRPIAAVEFEQFIAVVRAGCEANEGSVSAGEREVGSTADGQGDSDHAARGCDDSAVTDHDVELSVYDVVDRAGHPPGERVPHPFHGSDTGTNFMVDEDGETFRCWRHDVTGNADHLIGIEQGVVECGAWDPHGLDAETWRDIYDAGREAGYDIPEPEPQGVTLPGDDGAITWDLVRTMFADSDTPRGRALKATAELLCERETFATMSDTEEMYRYNPETGIYEPAGNQHIGSMLEAGLGEHYSSSVRNEVLTRIRDRTWTDRDSFGGSRDDPTVCVGNGVLDIETLELYDHSPDREFIRRIPWDWPAEDDAEPEAFDAFLGSVVGDEESKQTVYEVLGLAIHPGYLKAGFLLLYGDGRNGKSTLLEALERVIHPENVSSRSIQDIATDDHATASLYGKLANICGDLPNDRLPDTGMLKQLTGGDLVTANPKHHEPFSFHNEAVLMFSTNDPPAIDDDSTALARRLLLVNCPNEFTPEGEPGPDLRPKQEILAEITSPEECQAILRRAVEAVRRVRETGSFADSDSTGEVRERYRRASDPIYAFQDGAIEETSEGFVATSDLYNAYKTWCEANDAPVKDKGVFIKKLQTHVRMDQERPRRGGSRVTGYAGISLTEDGAALLDDDDPDAASLEAW